MAGSSNTINYGVRTQKSIERNMMCELISCLGPVEDYRYVGMGAKFFADFILIHKRFGIQDMISLEMMDDATTKARFDFNKPYNCITIEYKKTSDLLKSSSFVWGDKPSIVWFDYDGYFGEDVIEDVASCAGKLKSMSMFFVSFNIRGILNKMVNLSPEDRLDKFCKIINNEKYTKGLTVHDVSAIRLSKALVEVLNIALDDVLLSHNRMMKNSDDEINIEQIAFFEYADGAPMVTTGWIIYEERDKDKVKSLGLEKFPFCKKRGSDCYKIDVPPFTFKELAVLNRNMPNPSIPIEEAPFLSKNEIEKYQAVYRYYPTTIETGLVL